jgi:hypothetical protein
VQGVHERFRFPLSMALFCRARHSTDRREYRKYWLRRWLRQWFAVRQGAVNTVRGPGFFGWDASLIKNFNLHKDADGANGSLRNTCGQLAAALNPAIPTAHRKLESTGSALGTESVRHLAEPAASEPIRATSTDSCATVARRRSRAVWSIFASKSRCSVNQTS